jgi:hypothetical protein
MRLFALFSSPAAYCAGIALNLKNLSCDAVVHLARDRPRPNRPRPENQPDAEWRHAGIRAERS